MAKKEIVLSGMRPTGELHLGNYFGALRQWASAQDKDKCYFMIADLHSLTTLETTKNVKEKTLELAGLWLASGLNPKKSTIFLQSAIPEHGELGSIFSTLLPVSMLELNPTYKEMVSENPKAGGGEVINIGAGRNFSVNELAELIGGPVVHELPRLEPHDTLANNSLAKKLLGWAPKVSLEKGIAELKRLYRL